MYSRLTQFRTRLSVGPRISVVISFAVLIALLLPSSAPAYPLLKPACREAGDTFSSRIIPVYAHNPGEVDPNATKEIRERLEEMNWALQAEAEHMTAPTLPLRFVMDCNALGEPIVHDFPTLRSEGNTIDTVIDTFNEIAVERGEYGYGHSRKYFIWDIRPEIAGMAYGSKDSDKTASENSNNLSSRHWATTRNWDEPGWPGHELHEVFHSLGAVNGEAPFYSSIGHCEDDHDLMCAGGPSETFIRCPDKRWAQGLDRLIDCGEDTYLDPIAEPGEWLATHYNLGEDSSHIIVPPGVTSGTPSEIASTKAVLNGTVNPRGKETRYHFEYGPTTQYGSSFPVSGKSAGSGSSNVAVSEAVAGLAGGTTYHYRLVAEKESAAIYGQDQTFTTLPGGLPVVTAEQPAPVSDTSMSLAGAVNPNKYATDYHFEYGPTAAYGSKTATVSLASGSSSMAVKASIAGLSPATTYHYRLVASNKEGVTHGPDVEARTCQAGGCQVSLASAPNPTPVPKTTLDQVSCGSPTECVAIGYDRYQSKSVVARWSAGAWALTSTELEGKVADVSCVETHCYAVGMGQGKPVVWKLTEGKIGSILGFPLTGGSSLPLPAGTTSSSIEGISCSAKEACTAVGSYKGGGVWNPLVERLSGEQWAPQSAPSPEGVADPSVMLAVSCPSASSCTTVGSSGGKPTAHRWNGTTWSVIAPNNPAGATNTALEGVSCTATGCMAVGRYTDSSGVKRSLAESWNGSSWSTLATPAPAETPGPYELSDVSCLSQSSCFAVGHRVSAMKAGNWGIPVPDEARTLVEVWDGTSWTVQASPSPAENKWSVLSGISCASSASCKVVGGAYKTTTSGESATLAQSYE
jgi:hypothetical protein